MSKFHDEFFHRGTPEHDRLVLQTIAARDEIVESILKDYDEGKVLYQTEVICRSGRNDFIVGYADLVLHYTPSSETAKCTTFIVECKPKLDSWGDTLRQLKTYMDLLRWRYETKQVGLITTYSAVDDAVRQILAHEGVAVRTLDRETGKLL
ncbi:MAG: hypothetical protein ACXQS4_02565 [Methermicoccaceae archaeon]